MTLKELELGAWFYPKSQQYKSTPIFTKLGNCEFNPGHGSSTCKCLNNQTNEIISKSCRLEIIKFKYQPKPKPV